MVDLTSGSIPQAIHDRVPTFWSNPQLLETPTADPFGVEVAAAERRMRRAAPLIAALFGVVGGVRSPLRPVPALAKALGCETNSPQGLWIKADHELAVAGSVKARGGFHEIIALAERLVQTEQQIDAEVDLTALASPDARRILERHTVMVGSTGNLGMGIGLISSALGFRAIVHMSHEAKAWKKKRLRGHGVDVIEHRGDYAAAVEAGRIEAAADPLGHFVDDERSVDLMVGYATAAAELREQLSAEGITIDADRPLVVHIPCGVGGAPGGIAYGLKRLFGGNVHCIFAEPVESPCMLVQLSSGTDAKETSVYDIGLSNRTEADGLAVGQASMLVAPLMRERVDAIYTVSDDQLLALCRLGHETENLFVEPSAASAFAGPIMLGTPQGREHLERVGLADRIHDAVQVLWTTGGSLVPAAERAALLARARLFRQG